jgi:hypothetical protein
MLDLMPPNVHIWISHLNANHREQILSEVAQHAPFTLNIADLEDATIIDL